MNRQYMNNATRKITITDNNQAIEDGVTKSVTVEEIRGFLRDNNCEVTISNIGLYRIGWESRNGTLVSPQTIAAGVVAGKVGKVAKVAIENKLEEVKKEKELLAKSPVTSSVFSRVTSSMAPVTSSISKVKKF